MIYNVFDVVQLKENFKKKNELNIYYIVEVNLYSKIECVYSLYPYEIYQKRYNSTELFTDIKFRVPSFAVEKKLCDEEIMAIVI